MNKKTKSGIILTSLAAIAFAGSLLAGSTYALFTSESKNSIVVQSGKVDVKATISNLKTYSGVDITGDVEKDASKIVENAPSGEFTNGGKAEISTDNGTLTLSKLTPGDKVTFKIDVTNTSNVSTKYRTVVSCEEDDGLFAGLKCTFTENNTKTTFSGLTTKSKWKALEANGAIGSIECSVELPTDADKEYQGKNCKISYTIEAVQGNAEATDPEGNTIELYNVTDLKWFQKNVSNLVTLGVVGNSTITVKLMKNIDLNGVEWTPINYFYNADTGGNKPVINFDGNNKIISNFKVFKNQEFYDSDDGKKEINGLYKNLGFFGKIAGFNIEKLNVEKATVKGAGRVGAIVGQTFSSIENCTAKDCEITAEVANNDDGDKAGGIAGQIDGSYISGCTVTNCKIYCLRDSGGLVGMINVVTDSTSNNNVYSTKIYYNSSQNVGSHNGGEKVDLIVGRIETGTLSDSNKADENTDKVDTNSTVG